MNPTEIIHLVADEMGVDKDFATNKSRKTNYVFARHLCMYIIAKKHPRMSQTEISSLFNVQRADVSKAITRIESDIAIYPTMRGKIGYLMGKV